MNIISILVVSFIIYLFLSFYKKNFERKDALKGPVELPIVGSLLYFSKMPHHDLTNWSKKYGKTYKLWMGDYYTIVVSDSKMIREIWLKNFESFSDRPHTPAYTYLSDDFHDLSSADYQLWKNNRNIVANAFTKTKLKNIGSHLDRQCGLLIKRMNEFKESGETFYPKNHLKKYSLNIILSMVFSEEISYDEGVTGRVLEELIIPMDKIFESSGTANPLDTIYILKPLMMYLLKNYIEKDYNTIRNYLRKVYQEHLKDIDPENPRDLYDQIISAEYPDNKEKNIIGIGIDMISAGTDTSASTLFWFCLFMTNNPHIQEKAYAEIKALVGEGKEALVSHRIDATYINAIIKETLRIKPIGPLSLPRACVKDVEINGIQFRKGDALIMNIYGLHHDADYWNEPERFIPERFVGNNHTEYWLPFSVGPRNCVGLNLAVDEIFIAAANILLNFKLTSATGKPIDENEVYGLTIHPKDFGIKLESRN